MHRCFSLLLPLLLASTIAHAADAVRCPPKVTSMDMTKGEYSPMPGATFVLQNFAAQMVARGSSSPLCFNRTTDIRRGQVFISSESLTHLFSQKIEQSSSKIKDVKVEIKDNEAHLSGTMKKGMDVHFELVGPVTTDGTNLVLNVKKIKADGIPVKGLLGMMGKDLGEMLGSESVEGVKAEGDKLIFVPASISHVRGRIAKLDLSDKGMSIDFEGAQKKQLAANKTSKSAGARD